jgi:hypothetical protein
LSKIVISTEVYSHRFSGKKVYWSEVVILYAGAIVEQTAIQHIEEVGRNLLLVDPEYSNSGDAALSMYGVGPR